MAGVAELSLRFPVGGLNEITAFEDQPGESTADAQNVRPFDPGTGRARGGQRSGLTRHINTLVSGANPIQCLEKFELAAAYTAANTLSIRTIKLFAISNGTAVTGTTSYSAIINGAGFTAASPVIYAARHYDDLFVADGGVAKYFDSSANEIKAWTVTAGSHPGVGCRLICSYNNRIILSGLATDPQNYFAAKVGDPFDFDYSPATVTSVDAFAGNQGTAGSIADKINSLVPIPENDALIFGCDSSIWQMSGDISAGGRVDRISGTIGMAWGRAYCFNRQGDLYFWGSRGGLFAMQASTKPVSLSDDKIPEKLKSVDLSDNLITMAWDDRFQGINIYITPLDGSATTNYYYDERTGTFWTDVFSDASHNPVSVLLFDGDSESDRVTLLGCQDGYVRKIDKDNADDDASAISSYVYFGPLQSPQDVNVILEELTATMAAGSSSVSFEIYVGDNAEEAFNSTLAFSSGTWSAGRNVRSRVRVNARSFWIKVLNVTSGQSWSIEKIDGRLRDTGRSYARTFR